MRSSKSIKLKAAFLLTVFTLNILISFACSVGIDIGFNQNHHADGEKKKSHSHSHDQSLRHHSHATTHTHLQKVASGDNKNAGKKDNCCNEKTVELQKFDKSANHSSNPVIKIPVFIGVPALFLVPEIRTELSSFLNKSFIPQYYPPPDKRIIIQSFQI